MSCRGAGGSFLCHPSSRVARVKVKVLMLANHVGAAQAAIGTAKRSLLIFMQLKCRRKNRRQRPLAEVRWNQCSRIQSDRSTARHDVEMLTHRCKSSRTFFHIPPLL